ncbi:NEDD4 family-interacting protein 1-like isoform X1 [Rhopilema esculentum]|uniref:NEDD4 family-interacting protein 1-like isoform X1 n=1 Tax=Rhopilema esculentum TaxID=499914 RepID=UPI0031CF5C06
MANPPPYSTIEEDVDEPTQNPDSGISPDASPPPYHGIQGENIADTPPSYNDIVKPPSYDEVEAMHRHSALQQIFGISDDELELQDRSISYTLPVEEQITSLSVGSDYAFVGFFFLSFILNWIGFLVGYCLGNTYAAKYGSTAGFGLSLIKWAFLIKHADCCIDVLSAFPWITWLFVIAGWVMFLKGTVSFSRIKRGGQRGRLWIF